MCASHTLAHVLGRKYREGLPTTPRAFPGRPADLQEEARVPRMKVPESENRTRRDERTAALAEFRFSRYMMSMLAVSKLAMVASLVNRGDPCSQGGARRAKGEEQRGENSPLHSRPHGRMQRDLQVKRMRWGAQCQPCWPSAVRNQTSARPRGRSHTDYNQRERWCPGRLDRHAAFSLAGDQIHPIVSSCRSVCACQAAYRAPAVWALYHIRIRCPV
jgi:hypothetical protein